MVLLSLAVLALSSIVAATPGDCPTGFGCCASQKLRRSIVPRDECPASQKKCCEQEGKVVKVLPTSKTLQCGKSSDATAPLTIEIKACPSDATKQCLHFNFGSDSAGINYQDVHLGLYANALTDFQPPGQLNAKSYCSLTNGGQTADCWIPLAEVSSKFLAGADVCDQSLTVVAHTSYPGTGGASGNSCYGQGSEVPPGNNWAMQFPISFSCTTECIKECCCPAPVSEIWCPIGTGYGNSGSTSFPEDSLTPNNCKHWGWYTKVSASSLSTTLVTGTIWVGAGGNDISKATNAGIFSISKSGSTITVTYSFATGFKATETHIYAGCTAPTDCAPGKLGRTANANGVATFTLACSSDYYFVLHAAVSQSFKGITDCSSIPVAP